MQLYAITDRSMLGITDDQAGQTNQALAALARSWAEGGVAYIQIREKDLSSDALAALSEAVVAETRGFKAHVLVNGTPRVAAAAGAGGVHLPAGWTAEAIAAARNVFQQRGHKAIVSVACHSSAETVRARDLGADLALLSPVFEKRLRQQPAGKTKKSDPDLQGGTKTGMGLTVFREACEISAPLPIFALGGVTASNARQCVDGGAAGIAAIRLFMGKSASEKSKAEAWRALVDES
jgi:thiamine-phosphate pyrophosphorylase